MTFSKEWDDQYNAGRSGSTWPWSDLVTYVMRYTDVRKLPYTVLELGPATGANVPFFESLGVAYYGIEGSKQAVTQLHKKFPELSASIMTGDFTQAIPFDVKFDLIVDRASLTHNTEVAIRKGIVLIEEKLRPDGVFIGIDWFSTLHSDFTLGSEEGDRYTKTDIPVGQFKGIGKTHFSDKEHLLSLFDGFMITKLDHKVITQEIPTHHVLASWNFVAKRS